MSCYLAGTLYGPWPQNILCARGEGPAAHQKTTKQNYRNSSFVTFEDKKNKEEKGKEAKLRIEYARMMLSNTNEMFCERITNEHE